MRYTMDYSLTLVLVLIGIAIFLELILISIQNKRAYDLSLDVLRVLWEPLTEEQKKNIDI